MKNNIYFLLAIAALLLVGCESGASFTVINKSNYPIYASVEGIADIRASDEGKEGVQSFLNKRKPAWLAPKG